MPALLSTAPAHPPIPGSAPQASLPLPASGKDCTEALLTACVHCCLRLCCICYAQFNSEGQHAFLNYAQSLATCILVWHYCMRLELASFQLSFICTEPVWAWHLSIYSGICCPLLLKSHPKIWDFPSLQPCSSCTHGPLNNVHDKASPFYKCNARQMAVSTHMCILNSSPMRI